MALEPRAPGEGKPRIHPTAIVDAQAQLGEQVEIGPYAVIGPDVRLGARTRVGAHAVILGYTRIGEDCVLHPHSVLGDSPQDLKYTRCESFVEIGARNHFREFTTVHPGTEEGQVTRIGSDNLFMAYTHVAHNCTVGSHVIMANCAQIGGHVTVEDWAILGGMCAVHQFTRIGRHSIVGFGGRVSKDVAPFVKCGREPLRTVGLNSVGLARRGFSAETRVEIKRAYRILFRSELPLREAVARVRAELRPIPELAQLCAFVEGSERGLTL
jgi:UDP-N-acetylglucosamine acyltransferase